MSYCLGYYIKVYLNFATLNLPNFGSLYPPRLIDLSLGDLITDFLFKAKIDSRDFLRAIICHPFQNCNKQLSIFSVFGLLR